MVKETSDAYVCCDCRYPWCSSTLSSLSSASVATVSSCTPFCVIDVWKRRRMASSCVSLYLTWFSAPSACQFSYTTSSPTAGYIPNSTCCVTTRTLSWRDVSCVSRCACSNMADDEKVVLLACTSIVFLLWIWKFCVNPRNNFWKKWGGPKSTLRRNSWAPVVRVAPVALVVTSVSRRGVTTHKCDTARHDFFQCQNAWARYWRLTQQVEFGLICFPSA